MDEPVSLSRLKCPWCDYEHDHINSLRIHTMKQHQRSSQELYDAVYHPNGRPTCKCGCGQETNFFSIGRGYMEYLRGHVARVRNNWGHNEKVLKKSQDVRREMWKRGEIQQWMKGHTAKDDPRLAALGRKGSETIRANKTETAARSERMRRGRLDGTIPTQRGPDHPNWKGGLSSINNLAHSLLYKAWIFPKMVAGGFKCIGCRETRDICVHHSKERFSDLLREAASQVGYDELVHDDDFDKKSEVAQRLVDLHLERDVSGVVLCRECHAQAHELLGEPNEAAVIRSGAAT